MWLEQCSGRWRCCCGDDDDDDDEDEVSDGQEVGKDGVLFCFLLLLFFGQ